MTVVVRKGAEEEGGAEGATEGSGVEGGEEEGVIEE